ncbi:MAG: hypothetical protein AB7G93_01505 [Bdellovibrionales bacterium]
MKTVENETDQYYTHFYGDVFIAKGKAVSIKVKPNGPREDAINLAELLPDNVRVYNVGTGGLSYPFSPFCQIKNWNIKEDLQTILVAQPQQTVTVSWLEASRYKDVLGNQVLVIEGSIPVSIASVGSVQLACYAPVNGPVEAATVKPLLQSIFGNFAAVE